MRGQKALRSAAASCEKPPSDDENTIEVSNCVHCARLASLAAYTGTPGAANHHGSRHGEACCAFSYDDEEVPIASTSELMAVCLLL